MGRFNYWSYEFAHPEVTKDRPPPSADRSPHAKILKTFQQIRDDVGVAQRYHLQERLMRVGIAHPSPDILALAYYLRTSRLWSQDREAWRLLRQQPADIQDMLKTWARGVWHRRTLGDWDALLQTIASDQVLFQEILALGPTKAGLVDTQRQDGPPIWKKYRVSEAVAWRVYRAYHRKMSELLGRGVIVSKAVRDFFRARGTEVPRVRPTHAMAGLPGLPPD